MQARNGAGRGLFLWTDQALVYAGLKHFDVVSASLGGYIPKCGSATNPNGCDHPDYILLQRATQFARANGVLPVAAAGNEGWDLSDGAFFRSYIEASIPMGRVGQAGEMADAILWLLSDQASFITGAMLDAAGGGYNL